MNNKKINKKIINNNIVIEIKISVKIKNNKIIN